MGRATHVARMALVILFLAAAGFFAQWILKPQGFGKAGRFRYGSLEEIASQALVHQTKAACAQCHAEIVKRHGKDIHFGVQCEDCHGPGQVHVLFHEKKDTTIAAKDASMPKEYTLEGCLFCHRKLAARPRDFPQIDPEQHYAFLHVKDARTRCIECHSPHEPLFLLTSVEQARIHPVIYECGSCHDANPGRPHSEVKDHPAIFVCRDCHGAIVSDFEGRSHGFMACTACHLYHRENDAAGRIFKDGNRLFCQLCHEAKPFKDGDAVPQIEPEKHLAAFAQRAGKDPKALQEDPRACLACHLDFIHDTELLKKDE